MPSTHTTDRILIESCVFTQCPACSRKSLCGIFNHWYVLLSVSLVSEHPEHTLSTLQTEFTSNLVSSPSVRTAPDIFHVAFLIIGISCYRYLLYRNLLLSIFLPRMHPYLHHRQNSHRILCPHPASDQLQTLLMGHL